jgi:hypothetical protein
MPTSFPQQISTIVRFIMHLNPKSILDIGVGFGKYGMLSREYLEVWGHESNYGRFTRRIDGIEAFPEYLTPLHKYVYDHIYPGNALKVVDTLEISYDLVIMVDVLEHFSKKEGKALIAKLLKKHRGVLISTPKEFLEQHDTFENEFETHRSHWSCSDLASLGSVIFLPSPWSWIVYVGSEKEVVSLRRSWRMARLKEFASRFPWVVSLVRALKKHQKTH